MILHSIIDLIALLAGLYTNFYVRRYFNLKQPLSVPEKHIYSYFLFLIIGLVGGSILFGTLNIRLAGMEGFAKSLLGGIAGAIFMAEIFKKWYGITGSTGFYFIPSLCVVIIIGRIGCYFAGLADFTYGIETTLAWGVDFGDQIKRHPVQLYESFSMLLFLVLFIVASYKNYRSFLIKYGFYLFVIYYAGQRFLWEFLKPYPTLIGSLNIFHLLALVLIFYALIMLRKTTHDA